MKFPIATLTLSLLLSAWPVGPAAAGEPPALSHNPFSRPSSEVVRTERSIVELGNGSIPTFPLQATMVGHTSSLANVGGRILKPGDEYQGYRLLSVHERHAVFEKDGRNMTIYVKPERIEDDE